MTGEQELDQLEAEFQILLSDQKVQHLQLISLNVLMIYSVCFVGQFFFSHCTFHMFFVSPFSFACVWIYLVSSIYYICTQIKPFCLCVSPVLVSNIFGQNKLKKILM